MTALSTPCHTSGHICYYVESEDHMSRAVFTGITEEMSNYCTCISIGDTLFIGGCGKFFEGTAEQMFHALCEVLAGLPADTVCSAHMICYNAKVLLLFNSKFIAAMNIL